MARTPAGVGGGEGGEAPQGRRQCRSGPPGEGEMPAASCIRRPTSVFFEELCVDKSANVAAAVAAALGCLHAEYLQRNSDQVGPQVFLCRFTSTCWPCMCARVHGCE